MTEVPSPENTPSSAMFERAFRDLPIHRLAPLLERTTAVRQEYGSLTPSERQAAISEALVEELGVFAKSEDRLGQHERVFTPLPFDEQTGIVGNFLISFNPAIHLLPISQSMNRLSIDALLDEAFEAELKVKALKKKGMDTSELTEEDEEKLMKIYTYNSTVQIPGSLFWTFAWHGLPVESSSRNRELEHVFFEERMKSLESIPLTRDHIVGVAALSLSDASLTQTYADSKLGEKARSKQKEPYYTPIYNIVRDFIKRSFNQGQFLDSDIAGILKEYLLDDAIEFLEPEAKSLNPQSLEDMLEEKRKFFEDDPIFGVATQAVAYAKNPSSYTHTLTMAQLMRDTFIQRKVLEQELTGEDADDEENPTVEVLMGMTPTGMEENSPASKLSPESEEIAITLTGLIFNQLLLANTRRLRELSISTNSISDIQWFWFVKEAASSAATEAAFIAYALQNRA